MTAITIILPRASGLRTRRDSEFWERNLFGYDKTVIRGGASISYDQTNYRTLADVAASSPNLFLAVITPGTGPAIPTFPDVPGFGATSIAIWRAA